MAESLVYKGLAHAFILIIQESKMNKNKIIEAMETERKSQGIQSNNNSVKPEITKKSEKTPHLALCHNSNPSANNRHTSLLLKTKSIPIENQVEITKQGTADCNFEMFTKGMTDPVILLELFQIMQSQQHTLLTKIMEKGKSK